MSDQVIKDLTLMLMYLTSWEEGLYSAPGRRPKKEEPKVRTCWKGYSFDVLNELTEAGLINGGGRSKRATFCEEGEQRALELLARYGISVEETAEP